MYIHGGRASPEMNNAFLTSLLVIFFLFELILYICAMGVRYCFLYSSWFLLSDNFHPNKEIACFSLSQQKFNMFVCSDSFNVLYGKHANLG